MFRHAFGSVEKCRSKRRHSFRPQLESLEARVLLDANPQLQLAADVSKTGFDLTRAGIDAAVLADEVAIASGVETPAGIAILAGLAPLMKYPGMVSDLANLVKDSRERNTTGMVGDLSSLTGKTLFAIGGDLISLQQDGMALANDLAHVVTGTPIPQSSPAPPPSPSPSPPPAPSVFGTFSATLVPSSTDGNVPPNASQQLTLTINADGSGSMTVSPFAGTPFTVNFPAGTAQLADDGSVSFNYGNSAGAQIGADAALSSDGNMLQGNFFVYSGDSNFDTAYFYPGTLNRQS